MGYTGPREHFVRIGSIGGNSLWSQVADRTTATAKARAGFEASFISQVGGDPSIPLAAQPKAIRLRAENARKAHFARMQFNSLRTRARKKAAREAAREKEMENGDECG